MNDYEQFNGYLYSLRHLCNVSNTYLISLEYGIPENRVITLINSPLHGSNEIEELLYSDNFLEDYKELLYENLLTNQTIKQRQDKNKILINQLAKARKNYCGVGTRKLKLFLNKLIKSGDKEAEFMRVALEIEDINITAKKIPLNYQDTIYQRKEDKLHRLIDIAINQRLCYGFNKSDIEGVKSIIYFELPNGEQISWHTNLEKAIPIYTNKWDGQECSTLEKLERYILSIYVVI